MDVKDLRSESDLSERNNDGSKYTQGSVALHCNRNKSYQDIGSIPLGKAEPTPVRPCAVIGPDRVVPPPASNDAFLKKGPVEPWPSLDNIYRRPPEYPHKLSSIQNPTRNISPRQTFQENMPRILVPPTYNAVRHSDEPNFNLMHDRNASISKNLKANMTLESKYCDVPYAINTLTNEHKNVRDAEMYVPSVNSSLTRTVPHGWPPSSVNMHASRTYGAHELYQYPQYPSCASQRPTVIPMARPHRTIQEDQAFAYPEHYYQDASARFKPYPHVKERFSQPRYEYIANYSSHPFHPTAPLPPHKYDLSKSGQSHPYPVYPHLKYLDNRVPDHTMDGYQRPTNQPPHYNIPYRSQVIHPTYAPVSGNSSQNKMHPYASDPSVKSVSSSKLPHDNSNKIYIDFENARNKTYPIADNYFVNDIGRVHPVKNQMVMPNYSNIGMHSMPAQQYYRKDNSQLKSFEYMPHFRSFEHPLNSNSMMRHAPQFSPNTLAISPSDSNTSNDTSQTHGTSQEDCGYVSQSSTASVRSLDSGIYRLPNEYYKRYDYRYGPVANSPTVARTDSHSSSAISKEAKQKQIDVRQFLQMWNEGEEENSENHVTKEIVIQKGSSDLSSYPKHTSNQDQLYVLGLVNVPSEELSKYEHIQKISKLPENIKGYNSLELLNQFEEVIESTNTSTLKCNSKEYQMPSKDISQKQLVETLPRPVSPLDVEAKISQSVIHKEVGCNFEIRPCSPKMLNVEVPAPVQNILGERVIEKVTNQHSITVKSPIPIKSDENSNCHIIKRQDNTFVINENPSCKMVRSPYAANNMNSVKANYTLQDLEINSGVCLASLPQLDNEIELNFPEVNQQFINANKKDGIPLTSNCPQTTIEAVAPLSDSKSDKIDVENGNKAPIMDESGKTFTKLSKYRKLKTTISAEHADNNQFIKAVRTDSVIIKNPENIKNIEDKLLECSYNVPINLSSHKSVTHESCNLDLQDKEIEKKENNSDIALDFSINKSDNGLPIIDGENIDSLRPLHTKVADILCVNNLYPSPNESKETLLNHTLSETDRPTAMKNSGNGFDKDTSGDPDVKNNDINLINACISAKSPPTNKQIDINYDADDININNSTDISEILEKCQRNNFVNSVKKLSNDMSKNIIASNENIFNDYEHSESEDFANGSDLMPSTENMTNDVEGREMMELLSSQNDNEGSNLMFDNEDNLRRYKSELKSSEDKNYFENDEISAKLEKLFQESPEDKTTENEKELLLAPQNNFNVLPTANRPKITSYKSKELYSPRIQKLLTYTEGLCLYDRNTDIQEAATKHTPINAIIKEKEYSQKQLIDESNMSTCTLDETTVNKISIQKISEDMISDVNFQLEYDLKKNQSNGVEHINVCHSSNENYPLRTRETGTPKTIKTLTPEKTIDLITRASCLEIDKIKEKDVSDRETNSSQASEFDTIRNNIVKFPNIPSMKNSSKLEVITTNDEELREINTTDQSVCKLKIRGENSVDRLSNFASSDSEDKKSLIEIVSANNNMQMYSEKCIDATADSSMNNGFINCLSKNIAEYHTGHQNDIVMDTIGDDSEMSNSNNDDVDNNYNKSLISNNLEKVSSNMSVDNTGHDTKDEKHINNLNKNAPKNSQIAVVETEQENLINSCKATLDNRTTLQTLENENKLGFMKEVSEKCNSDFSGDKPDVVSIVSEDLSNSNTESSYNSDSTYCSQDQIDNKLFENTSIVQNLDCSSVIAPQPSLCIKTDYKSDVNIESVNRKIETLCSDYDEYRTHQKEGKESKYVSTYCGQDQTDNDLTEETAIEQIKKNLDSGTGKTSLTFLTKTSDDERKRDNLTIESPITSVYDEYKTHQRRENQCERNLMENEHSGSGKALCTNSINNSKCGDNIQEILNNFGSERDELEHKTLVALDSCNIVNNDIDVDKVHNVSSISDIEINCNKQSDDSVVKNSYKNEEPLFDNNTNEFGFNEHDGEDLINIGVEDRSVNDHSAYKTEENNNRNANLKVTALNCGDCDRESNDKMLESLITSGNEGFSNFSTVGKAHELLNCVNTVCENNNEGQVNTNVLAVGESSNITDNSPAKNTEENSLTVNLIANNNKNSIIGDSQIIETLDDGNLAPSNDAQIDSENSFVEIVTEIIPKDYTCKTIPDLSPKFNIKNANENTFSNNLGLAFDSCHYVCELDNITLDSSESSNTSSKTISDSVYKNECFKQLKDQNKVSDFKNDKFQVDVYKNDIVNLSNVATDKQDQEQNKMNPSNKTNTSYHKVVISPEISDSETANICYQSLANDNLQSKNEETKLDSKDTLTKNTLLKPKFPLKRSLSDSALDSYKNKDAGEAHFESSDLIWPAKRKKNDDIDNSNQVIDENICSIIQNNRRNSVSSFYNEANVSFCILIDNDYLITEENEEEKICIAEISEDCITEINNVTEEEDTVGEIICCSQQNDIDFSDSIILEYDNEKSIQESWLDDVACVETVVSDDIEDDVESSHDPQEDIEVSIPDCNETILNYEHISGFDLMDDQNMLSVSHLEENDETPFINFDKLSYDNGSSQDTEICNDLYGAECIDEILSESNSREYPPTPPNQETILQRPDNTDSKIPEDKENIYEPNIKLRNYDNGKHENNLSLDINQTGPSTRHIISSHLEDTSDSCKFSTISELCDKTHVHDSFTISSSPEVSSTTSEEKSSSILLKITNYNGSRISEINEVTHNKPRCKFTEDKDYSNSNGIFPKRPLLTKAAQKYIPPLKESIRDLDLKVKLTLPQQRLIKLKQLKLSRSEIKPNKQSNSQLTISKKPKPNFEDVLKNIDEVQIKMHKKKSKKPKNIIPKVVIKKNLNGSHYTSSSNKDTFNPDLTGRKWQPWVFLEKNHFIDKMAIRNKTKAIYNYRKNMYVLAEKFKKYKSVCNSNAKFVISQPKTGESSKGQLKYTIRLKHTY